MKHDEYSILKEWKSKTPKEKLAYAVPVTDVMTNLIDQGLLKPITRPDASTVGNRIIVGYDVTEAGEDALNEYMRRQV